MLVDRNEHTVKSNVQGDNVAMSIDVDAFAHIMDVLTDLYSDSLLAVIREYSTNAWDAHIAAGQSRAIEVSLPTRLSPLLRIKDFGLGLDYQDIVDTYSKYGASTKRGGNDQVGQLGLGCKSALTYASQFTITGVKDGYRNIISVTRDEDGGSMTVVDSQPTDEPNGVEVSIPCTDASAVRRTAMDFYRFWPEGSVLVDGQAPDRITGMNVTDNMLLTTDVDQDYIVMGNVPYPVEFHVERHHSRRIVAYVGIGEVNFAPSREQLRFTTKTKNTIEAIQNEYRKHLKAQAQKDVNDASTRPEAIDKLIEWQKALGPNHPRVLDGVTYQGKTIPTTFTWDDTAKPEDREKYLALKLVSRFGAHNLSAHEVRHNLDIDYWSTAIWVTNYDQAKFTPTTKKKLLKWSQDTAENGSDEVRDGRWYVLLPPGKLKNDWIDPAKVVDWSTIKAVKLPVNRDAAPGQAQYAQRLKGSYDGWIDGEAVYETPADDIDTSHPVYFVQRRTRTARSYASILSKFVNRFTLVELAANRIDKFQRDFPMAKDPRADVEKLWRDWQARLTDDQKAAFALNDAYNASPETYKYLDAARINDPKLKQAARIAQVDLTKLERERTLFGRVLNVDIKRQSWDCPLAKYPLAASARYRMRDHRDHITLYVNAVYNSSNA